ncbi:hypothetical protein PQX77_015853 [Marasmius sp. AFHP31]|nr:hypothetical protein PQX77_015853 [Marasmius sp. AFHP31]
MATMRTIASSRDEFFEGSTMQDTHDDSLAYADRLELPEQVERRIQALVTTAELLGLKEPSFVGCLGALTNLSSKRLTLKQSLYRTEYAVKELETHLAMVEHEQRLLNGYAPLMVLHTLDFTITQGSWKLHFDEALMSDEDSPELLERKRQALLKKAREYKRELENIKLEDPPVTVSDLSAQQDRNKETEERIRQKRAKLKVFQGLPPVSSQSLPI